MSETQQQVFEIQRMYVKDISFEAPSVPQIFLQEWKPEISVDLQVNHAKLEQNIYEVLLGITVTAKLADKTAFLVEVKQAGIFAISGFPEEQMEQILQGTCANILFPFVREAINDAVVKASFPQLLLSPINFDAVYLQKKQGNKLN